MKIVVLKFGGSSVGSIKKIKKITEIIRNYKRKNFKVIVVSSAMSGVTNELIRKSREISENFSDEEYDVLVSSGEQAACSLIAGSLIQKGLKARSWLAWQIPITTKGLHKNSRIHKINRNKIFSYLKDGGIPIIAGFQGINEKERITTIGRGGSDASAIMLAKFFKAKKCVIYTDVEGVYTTDPNKLKNAKKIKVISYEEMLEMASLGAKVMQPVSKKSSIINNKIITGISLTPNDAKVSLIGVKDKPGVAASIFKPLSKNSINVDMVVQNISANGKETDLTFTIKSEDLNKTKKIIKDNKNINFRKLLFEKGVSKISIIGVGMITTPGVTFRMFQALANKKINIQVISTSEIKISVLIDKKNTKKALTALHKEFKLDK